MARNDDKGPLFTTEERVQMLRAEVARFGDQVEVRPFAPGPKSGPIDSHRDGGGPDKPAFDEPDEYGDAPF